MKHILIFIDWYEPGFQAGGPIRSIKNLVDHFNGSASFSIVTRNTDYQSAVPYEGIQADAWNEVAPHVKVYYASSTGLKIALIRKLLQEQRWDTVYINGIYSWYFSLLPLLLTRTLHLRTVVAPRGMLAAGALGVKSYKKKGFLYITRFFRLFQHAIFHATHEGEAQEIKQQVGKKVAVQVAPNLPAVQAAAPWRRREKQRRILKLVSIARISPEKNTKYGLELLSKLPVEGVEVIFDLYGPVNDVAYWEDCLQLIDHLPASVKVQHKGSLPNEKVPSTLAAYHLMVLPSLGENFGHVIVEAFTAATPVLISDRTPWQSLAQKRVGWSLPLEREDQFVEVLQQVLLMEQEEYDQLSKNALEYAQSILNNKQVVNQYQALFEL